MFPPVIFCAITGVAICPIAIVSWSWHWCQIGTIAKVISSFCPLFNHVRAELKQDVKKNLTHLQKDRFAYIREFFDRIEEIRFIQKRLWGMIQDNPDKPFLQKSCLYELHQSTITLCNLYDSLPAVISARPDFVNRGYEWGVENYRSFHFDSNQDDDVKLIVTQTKFPIGRICLGYR